jgi:hypothetical protein
VHNLLDLLLGWVRRDTPLNRYRAEGVKQRPRAGTTAYLRRRGIPGARCAARSPG